LSHNKFIILLIYFFGLHSTVMVPAIDSGGTLQAALRFALRFFLPVGSQVLQAVSCVQTATRQALHLLPLLFKVGQK
jgi:hypothetical protein